MAKNVLHLIPKVLEKLLCYDFFPEKTTQILTAKAFGEYISQNNFPKQSPKNESDFYYSSYFQLRDNNVPRKLAIPHPYPYYELCKAISDHWSDVALHFDLVQDYANRSQIHPKANNKNNRLISMDSYESEINDDENVENQELRKADLILDKSLGMRYKVIADISNFYPSIYTHSLPWALHTRIVAKVNRSDRNLLGNILDEKIRNLQNGETTGIPIGSGAFNILAEIILAKVDQKFSEIFYHRYIDDYTAYFKSKDEAEAFILELSNELAEYRLTLNPKKTKIVELPTTVEPDWIHLTRSRIWQYLPKNGSLSKEDVPKIRLLFDLSLSLHQSLTDCSVLRYVAKIISQATFEDEIIFDFTLKHFGNLCYHYPYLTDLWVSMLLNLQNQQFIFIYSNKSIAKNNKFIANHILNNSIQRKHSDAVSHILLLALKQTWFLKLPNQGGNFIEDANHIITSILDGMDCVPMTFALLYANENNLDLQPFKDKITHIKNESLENEYWLFIYEAYLRFKNNWTNEFKSIKHKDLYNHLCKGKITFINLPYP